MILSDITLVVGAPRAVIVYRIEEGTYALQPYWRPTDEEPIPLNGKTFATIEEARAYAESQDWLVAN